jgi:hypothetical protein
MLCVYSTEIIATEALLQRSKVRDQTSLPDHLQRLEALDSILAAIKRWIDVFFDVPLVGWIGCTFANLAQLSHCIMLLYKLMSLDDPDLDKNEMKKQVDVLDILERLAQRLDSTTTLLGLVDDEDPEQSGLFFKTSRLLRALKATFSVELGQENLQTDVQHSDNIDPADFAGELFVQDDVTMCFAEDPWWTELMHVQGTFDL